MTYYVPIENLYLDINEISFNDFIKIKTKPYNVKEMFDEGFLSKIHFENINNIEYWLVIDNLNQEDKSIIVNLFFLSLWIISPINISTRYIFRDYDELTILFDDFKYNEKDNFIELTKDIFKLAATYFEKLTQIDKSAKRLKTALFNTYCGLTTIHSSVSLICLSAALEVLLLNDTSPKVTKRLCKSYACISTPNKENRDKKYNELYSLYNIRSNILHGRITQKTINESYLDCLSKFSDILRNLWTIILNDSKILNILENSDKVRNDFFKEIITGYTDPR